MQKNMTSLDVKKNERIYQFICENDSPLGEVYDAIIEMLNFVVDRMNQLTPKENKHENNLDQDSK